MQTRQNNIREKMKCYDTLRRCLAIFLLLLPVFVFAQSPVVNFSANVISGCAPLIVNFTDNSTNSPTSWNWDLGNGTITNVQNPTTSYLNPGTYTVTLTATNASGSGTVTKTAYITVNALPDVNFTTNDTLGCAPYTVSFTDLSTAGSGNISSWEWNFGDGGTSTLQNPTHVYINQGTYGIFLKVTNSLGCSRIFFKSQYVVVGGTLSAAFTPNIPSYCNAPVTVTFANNTTGSGSLNYNWNFGDGGTSTLQNPTHTYTSFGNYQVQLSVSNQGGCISNTVATVSIQPKQSQFSGPTSICAGSSGNFTVTSTPTPTTVLWDFGNGITYTTSAVTHTFTTPGNYFIKLKNDFGTCVDSIIKPITVHSLPVAGFSATDTAACKAPLTVNFQNNSAGANTYLWNFGNSITSTANNPTYTYTTAGVFTVSLTATNSFGCSDTFRRQEYIKITPPSSAILNLPIGGCKPYTFTPNVFVSSVDGVASYLWDFGDGATSTLANPSHVYNLISNYTIKLRITSNGGCIDTITVNNGVSVGDTTTVDFSATPTVVCSRQPVVFTPTPVSVPVTSYTWDFGDLTTSGTANPTKSYSDTGTFTVKLVINSNGCRSEKIKTNYVQVLPPMARFVFSKDCIQRNSVQFNSTSIGATSLLWDFGDGSPTSTQTNPQHNYATTGNYLVRLIAFNGTCSDTTTQNVKIALGAISLQTSRDTTCRRGRILFWVVSPDPSLITNYQWFFGDGNITNTINSPIAWDYTVTGNFATSVITTDINGCKDTAYKTTLLKVTGPRASFGSNDRSGCVATLSSPTKTVNFTDSSVGLNLSTIQTWVWDFGDGNTATSTLGGNTAHSYSTAGNFEVKLKVIDQFGCEDSMVRPAYVNLATVKTNFATPDFKSCPGSSLSFSDSTIGTVTNWLWSFGNGATSNLQNPTHVYNDTGVYTVKLKVTGLYGCVDSLSKVDYVTIKKPKAKFGLSDSSTTCPPFQVNFYDSSWYTNSWEWRFGDGGNAAYQNAVYVYFIPGQYTAKLITTSPGGCKDSATRTIKVGGPYGSLTYSPIVGCKGLNVNFQTVTTGAVSFLWDYADGVTLNTSDSLVTHIFNQSGKFVPRVLLKDGVGCIVPLNGIDTIHIQSAIPAFNASANVYCDTGTTQFTNSTLTNALPLSYLWNFGDGTTSTQVQPTHSYTSTGLYDVQLITTTPAGCRDTTKQVGYIKVAKSPKASILISDTSLCLPASFTFTPQLLPDTSTISSWLWTFGNGQTSNLQNPPAQIFSTANNFTNSLVVINSSGCKDSVARTIQVSSRAPVIILNNDTAVCRNANVPLQVNGASNYTWINNTTGLSCINCSNPTASINNSAKYVVRGTLPNGCVGEDSVTITMEFSQPQFRASDSLFCDNGNVLFNNNTFTNSTSINYLWSFGDGNNSVQTTPSHNYPTTGNYSVKLVTTTALGCKDSVVRNNYIKVVKSPVVSILSSTAAACAPASFNFTAQLQPDTSAITSWSWIFGNGNTSFLQDPPPQVFINTGNYNNTLNIINSSGCIGSSTQPITVYGAPNVTITTADTTICRGTAIPLVPAGATSYTWSTSSSGLSCTNCATPLAAPTTNSQFIVQGTDVNGCIAKDSINIKVMQPYTLQLQTNNTAICNGGTVQLNAVGAPNYAWSPSLGLSSSIIANPKATPTITTTYQVKGYDSLNCFNDSANVTVQVVDYPTVNIGPDLTLSAGTTVTLNPIVSNDVVSYNWSPAAGLSCINCPNPSLTAFDNKTYRLRVTNNGGCSSSDNINIIVTCDGGSVFIPNTFSPNGDGANDVFYVRGKGVYSVQSIRIFNRWGNLVFEKRDVTPNDPTQGWNGMVNGQKASADSYTYLVEVRCTNSQLLKYSGTISLIQ